MFPALLKRRTFSGWSALVLPWQSNNVVRPRTINLREIYSKVRPWSLSRGGRVPLITLQSINAVRWQSQLHNCEIFRTAANSSRVQAEPYGSNSKSRGPFASDTADIMSHLLAGSPASYSGGPWLESNNLSFPNPCKRWFNDTECLFYLIAENGSFTAKWDSTCRYIALHLPCS